MFVQLGRDEENFTATLHKVLALLAAAGRPLFRNEREVVEGVLGQQELRYAQEIARGEMQVRPMNILFRYLSREVRQRVVDERMAVLAEGRFPPTPQLHYLNFFNAAGLAQFLLMSRARFNAYHGDAPRANLLGLPHGVFGIICGGVFSARN